MPPNDNNTGSDVGNDDKVAHLRIKINLCIAHHAVAPKERLAFVDVAMTMPINKNKVVIHGIC